MSNQVYSNETHTYPINLSDNPSIVTLTGTQSLSNKTLVDPVITLTETNLNLIITGLNGSNNLPISLAYTRMGNTITLKIFAVSGSFGTAISFLEIRTLPSQIIPDTELSIPALVISNNQNVPALALIQTNGNIRFFLTNGTLWPTATTNGMHNIILYYDLV